MPSLTTLHSGVMTMGMDMVAILLETIQMIAQVTQVHQAQIDLDVQIGMEMVIQMLVTHSLMILHSGRIETVTTEETIQMVPIQMLSQMMQANGPILTVMGEETTLVETMETGSRATQLSGTTLTAMVLATTRMGITTTVARPHLEHQTIQSQEDVQTLTTTV